SKLKTMAEAERCAVVFLRHLNKTTGGSALYRGLGSIGIGAATRSMLIAGKGAQPEDEGWNILAQNKSNLGPLAKSLRYRLVSAAGDFAVARVEWGGEAEITAQKLISENDAHRTGPSKLTEAINWMQTYLAFEPVESEQFEKAAEDQGIAEGTYKRARKQA